MELISSYVFNRLLQIGDKILVIDSENGSELSASDIVNQSRLISKHLSYLGFSPGQVIAYLSCNCAEFVCISMGIIDTGAAVAFGNPNFTESELSKFLSMISPDAVIYNPNIGSLIQKVRPFHSTQFLSTSEVLNESLKLVVDNRDEEGKLSNGIDHVAMILLSSGTSGFPKPAMISHHAFITELEYAFKFHRDNLRVLAVLPFYHIYGLIVLLDSLCQKSSVITMSKFKPSLFIDHIKKYEISLLPIVPSLFLPLMKCVPDDLKSLRVILTGGAPANDSLISTLLDRTPHESLDIYNIYGMTETSGIICTTKVSVDHEEDQKSVGKLLPFLESKIMDPTGCGDLPSGSTGELCIRGDTVFLGYKNNVQATQDLVDEDGWLHTGDLAYRNSDGSHFIVGRIKELIKYQGNQISPHELESICRQHPQVEEVVVIGLPHEVFGELPAAVVVTREHSDVTAGELELFVQDQINPSKRLRGGVFLCSLDFIPRTVSGKVKRKDLLNKVLAI